MVETTERYFIAKSIKSSKGPYGSINPLFVGHSLCEKGHIYGPFRRKHFVFQYILSGEMIFESPYGVYKAAAGNMLIMHRGDLVNYSCIEEPVEGIWIEFDCTEPLPNIFDTGMLFCEELREIFLDLIKVKSLLHGHCAYVCSIIWRIIALLDTGEPEIKNHSH